MATMNSVETTDALTTLDVNIANGEPIISDRPVIMFVDDQLRGDRRLIIATNAVYPDRSLGNDMVPSDMAADLVVARRHTHPVFYKIMTYVRKGQYVP